MKAHVLFDTLAYANRLKAAGVTPKIAEVQAEMNAEMLASLFNDTVATKHDLEQLESRLMHQIQDVRTELAHQIGSVRSEMKEMEMRLTIRLGGITLGAIAFVTALPSLLHLIH